MKKFYDLIDETNENRIKVYYCLSELEKITGMSPRALKYRMLEVKRKYCDVPSLLSKKDRKWQIHYTIVDEFKPKYNTKNRTIETFNLKSIATWNPKYNYDVKYHIELIKEIKQQLPKNILIYTVEVDSRGINHTHLVTDAETNELNKAVMTTLKKYILDKNEIQVKVDIIINKFSTIEYIKKAPVVFGALR